MSQSASPADPEVDPTLRRSGLDFPVVGIGASAGGLAALATFLEAMPAEPGMAIVIVMHLSPRHDSIVDRILQRSTTMPVTQVVESLPLQKNHVYVISPRKALSMDDGHLRLSEMDRPLGKHVSIDFFFRTLAEVHREKAFAVILSGTGSDGSVGIARIRERGGITLVQHPDDAEYDQMPRAAIATGAADVILPVAELPPRIIAMAHDASRVVLPYVAVLGDATGEATAESELREHEDALRDIMLILRAKTGHDFRAYKQATVLRRIERRMQVNGLRTIEGYRDFLHEHAYERPALLKDMLISVTNFFRDRDSFEALEREVIPKLFEQSSQETKIRVWSAGCATGEEAYSLAMLLSEGAEATSASIQVFATDIDDDAIAHARHGVYPSAAAADITSIRASRFLSRDGDGYRVQKSLREKVLFARHNVLQDPPFSKLDLIVCRNLLIYLNRDVQSHALEMFHFALRPGGYLFLGSSESAEMVSKFFTPVDKKHRIYRATAVGRTGIYLHSPTRLPTSVTTAGATATAAAHDRRENTLKEIHRMAVEDRLPPSILVDRDGHVAHMSESAGVYLRLAGGAPSYQLTTLIVPELRLELRTSLFQATQDSTTVRSRAVDLEREGQMLSVSIEVRPVRDQDQVGGFQLVVFHEGPPRSAVSPGEVDDEQTPILLQLEEELKRAKEQLQATVEESETSNEELKASNEELQSINEELRSATEELETSKEELQSINEELITVNLELKLKVEETAKANDDLHNLVASTDIATVFVDREMSIKRFTPRAADVFRLIPADIGRSLLDLNHSLDYPDLASDASMAFQSLRTIEREVGSQDRRWYIARILPYRTAADRIEGAVITFIDITRRRAAEQAARSSEERMRLVADSALDYAIITTDPEGIITSWSKGAERMFRYSDSDAIGRHANLIFISEDRAQGVFQTEMDRARTQGRATDDRWQIRADGERIFCSGITTPLNQGGFHGYAKITRDFTQEKRREREREDLLQAEKASREAAQSAVLMKDEFLAVMSHELKHPLHLILMNAELIARSATVGGDEATQRSADAIRKTVEGQARIIDDLLDLSRLNTGKLALNVSEVNVSDCLRRVADGMREELSARSITLSLALPGNDVMMMADGIRIEQIVWNLLGNALKFTRAHGHVSASLSSTGDQVRLQVTDDGIGISPSLVGRLFEMFEQGSTLKNRSTGGLGIGLALVKQLVDLHGGDVTASSPGPDQGASFTVVLPTSAVRQSEAAMMVAARWTPQLVGRRIVVVDDAEELLEPFADLLRQEGATVVTARSGAEALSVLASGDHDVLLSDIGMPGMDGHELIETLRSRPATKDIVAVALTGFGRPQDERRALKAGFDAHISKPVSMHTLLAVLARFPPPIRR
jgi:two-component system CheB/CheR fusion protein